MDFSLDVGTNFSYIVGHIYVYVYKGGFFYEKKKPTAGFGEKRAKKMCLWRANMKADALPELFGEEFRGNTSHIYSGGSIERENLNRETGRRV